jgi:hypothetical protein
MGWCRKLSFAIFFFFNLQVKKRQIKHELEQILTPLQKLWLWKFIVVGRKEQRTKKKKKTSL